MRTADVPHMDITDKNRKKEKKAQTGGRIWHMNIINTIKNSY